MQVTCTLHCIAFSDYRFVVCKYIIIGTHLLSIFIIYFKYLIDHRRIVNIIIYTYYFAYPVIILHSLKCVVRGYLFLLLIKLTSRDPSDQNHRNNYVFNNNIPSSRSPVRGARESLCVLVSSLWYDITVITPYRVRYYVTYYVVYYTYRFHIGMYLRSVYE